MAPDFLAALSRALVIAAFGATGLGDPGEPWEQALDEIERHGR